MYVDICISSQYTYLISLKMLHKYNTIDVTHHLQHLLKLNGALFNISLYTYCVYVSSKNNY